MSFLSGLAKFSSTLGGAIGAQATGGSQGLQAFMSTLARQQEQELQRSFERERDTRQRMFQMDRDRLAHERALELQQNELAAKQSADVERNEAAANELVAWGRLNKGNEDALQSAFAAAMGPNTPTGTVAPLDLNDPAIVERVRGALSFGMTFGATRARAEEKQAQGDWVSQHAPTVQLDDKDPQGQVLKLQQSWNAAQTALSTAKTNLDGLQARWQALDPAKADPQTLAQEATALNDELSKLAAGANNQFGPGGAYSYFVTPGARLTPAHTAIGSGLDTLSKSIDQGLENRALNSLVDFNPADLSTWVPGLDGFEDTSRSVISSPQFDRPNIAWGASANAIVDLPSGAYSQGSGQEAFRQELATMRSEYNEANKPFDLRTLMYEWTAATETGDTAKADAIARVIQGVAREDVPAVQQRVALEQKRAEQLANVTWQSTQLAGNERLGVNLVPDEATAKELLAKFGQEDGPMRVMGDANQFWSRVLASDDGLDLLIDAYGRDMVDEGAGTTIQDQAEQVYERASYGINQLGFTVPGLKQRLQRRFAANFGLAAVLAPATVGAEFTDVDLAGISATSPENMRSVRGLILQQPKGQDLWAQWRKDFGNGAMGGTYTRPDDREMLSRTLVAQSQREAPYFKQKMGGFTGPYSRQALRGEHQRLRIKGEEANYLDGNFSAYDVFTLWRNHSGFSQEFEYGGAIQQKAIKKPAHKGKLLQWDATYKPWATGTNRDYIFGDKSHAEAYETMQVAEGNLIDRQLRLQLGYIDYIQAADLDSTAIVTTHRPEMLSIMRDQQAFFRNIPTAELVNLMEGEGFSPEQLALARTTEEIAAEVGRTMPIPRLDEIQATNQARLEQVVEERLDLEGRAHEIGMWMDLDPTTGEDWGTLKQAKYEHTLKQLAATEADLQARIDAANSSIVRDTRKSLMGITGVPSSVENLGAVIKDASAWWTGETIDMVAVEERRLDSWAAKAAQAPSAKEGVRILLGMVADEAAQQSAAMSRSLASVTEREQRPLTLASVEREVSVVMEEIDALAEWFVSNSPGSLDDIPDVYMQRGLGRKGVDKLIDQLNGSNAAERADAAFWLGFQAWQLQEGRSEN